MRTFALAIAVCTTAVALGAEPGSPNSTTPGSTPAPATTAPAVARAPLHEHPILQRMLSRNNGLRSRIGLRPHRISPELTKAAQDHAVYMARTHDFNHYSNLGPNGRAGKYGYRGSIRENIAMGQGDVDGAFSAWQASGAHWASIVSGTMDAGFGYAVSANGTPFWVAVYGYPAAPPKTAAPATTSPAKPPVTAPMTPQSAPTMAPRTSAPAVAPATEAPPARPASAPMPKAPPATAGRS